MPSNSKEYIKKNYRKYWGSPEGIKATAGRNKARTIKKAGPGKEVDHIDGNPRNNNPSNLRVISRKKNRQLGAKKANGK